MIPPIHLFSTQAFEFYRDFLLVAVVVFAQLLALSFLPVGKKAVRVFRIGAASVLLGFLTLIFSINAVTALPGVKDMPMPENPRQGYHSGLVAFAEDRGNGETWVRNTTSKVWVVIDKGPVPTPGTFAHYMCDLDTMDFPKEGPSTAECFYMGAKPQGLNYFAK